MGMAQTVIWDPLRKKEVALTPEEEVRQWCIGVLNGSLGVPLHMMMSEASFKLGEKKFRADIIVYDRDLHPMVVVECKRPEVELSNDVLDQAIRYNMVLDVRYILITNGKRTIALVRRYEEGKVRYELTGTVPSYNEMVCQQL